MVSTAFSLFILGFFFLIGAIVSVIFTIISFANNKSSKYGWLASFLVCLIAVVFCVFTFVQKAVNKVEHFANDVQKEMMEGVKNYADTLALTTPISLQSNEQIRLLKSYYPDSTLVPEQFYYYLGFENYHRYPLRYPYSIHCSPFKDAGELYNEEQVKRFDENDNGEVQTTIDKIDRLAFDKNYALFDRKVSSTRSADFIHHYIFFSFETGKFLEADTEKELIKLARKQGYKGSDQLITIQEYDSLFQ